MNTAPSEIVEQVLDVVDSIGKSGAETVEFGWMPDDPDDEEGPSTWYAKVKRGPGDFITADARSVAYDGHAPALRAALLKAWAECVRQSGRSESQVHPWKWPSRREAIAGARELLEEIGVRRTLVVHNATRPGLLPHRDSDCWCQPDLVEM